MTFDLTPTAAQHDLARRTHEFSEEVIRPVALGYDRRQEFPWPVLEEAATLGTFEQTRPMVAAQAIGIARAALEYATAYATEREAFGGPIIDNQGIAFPLAELATQIDIARLLTWRASWMATSGVPFERGEGSLSKLAASEVAVKATERAIQTPGGWGYITDHPVEKVVSRCQALHHL